ncbi:class I glutamine amidotransferase-like protein [Polyplosphaeria fusca]|uniref:Class I glutamine amidotransferase-like protein n=1 Tax=Polyplosphaeria fusca TaxID=682080 RepID=A0A9P4QUE7_9PLEO|nr:class I glutamine amidotransferase-like protein [Polyplosphaeria fusca]
MATHTIRIAMLNADIPVPNVFAQRGTYGNIFHTLLSEAAARTAPGVKIESADYDVREGHYPASLSNVDVLLITGSASSAYDNVEWIKRLDDYVLDVYTTHPRIKMFGSCFGHQLMCQSLLRPYGVIVENDPNGWELGVKEVLLKDEYRSAVEKASTRAMPSPVPQTMRLQMVHADHVRIPSKESLPESWTTVGRTKHCAVQGMYQPGRVLTLQGHFEFDRFVNSETMKVFGAKWDSEVLKKTLEAIDADDNSLVAAEMVVRFLTEEGVEKGSVTRKVVGGLLTPPLQE